MDRRKKKPSKPWCWYCNREFEDEKVLIQHQMAKHFKCHLCHQKLDTVPGLAIHCLQVHVNFLEEVPNALPNRNNITIEIYGMEGIPAEDIREHESQKHGGSRGSDSSEDERLKKKRNAKVPIRYRNNSEMEEDEGQSVLGKSEKQDTILKKKRKIQESQLYALPNLPPAKVITDVHKKVTSADKFQVSDTLTETNDIRRDSFVEFLRAASAHKQSSLEKILKLLEEQINESRMLRKEVRELQETVELKFGVAESPQVAPAISGIITESFDNLPLGSFNELRDLESEITSDALKATSLARFLCRGSGFNSMNALIIVIMKRLLKREIAMQFSLEGKQGKNKFSDLNLLNVIVASVKMKYEEAESHYINNRIGRVLAGSSDWDGNRIRGKRKEMSEVVNTNNF